MPNALCCTYNTEHSGIKQTKCLEKNYFNLQLEVQNKPQMCLIYANHMRNQKIRALTQNESNMGMYILTPWGFGSLNINNFIAIKHT